MIVQPITFSARIKLTQGSFHPKFRENELVLPKNLKGVCDDLGIDDSASLISTLNLKPEQFEQKLGWSTQDVLAAREELRQTLKGRLPNEVLYNTG